VKYRRAANRCCIKKADRLAVAAVTSPGVYATYRKSSISFDHPIGLGQLWSGPTRDGARQRLERGSRPVRFVLFSPARIDRNRLIRVDDQSTSESSALVPQAVGHALQAARRCDRPGGRAHGSPNAMHGASADAKLFGGCENTFAGPQLALDSFFDVGSDLPRVEPLSTAR
jgi:hypothetical protein